MKKGIYKLNIDCGRQGDLSGVFVSTDKYVEKLLECGVEVYFGEVLGKHSEVYGQIDDNEIKLVTDDSKVVELFEEFDLSSGINPFQYSQDGNFEIEGVEEVPDDIIDIIKLLLKLNK